jgi:hypothetical protein
MHHSLDTSLKQLTCFFDVQKNLSFSLENNNTINTYIHSNDREPIRSEPIFPLSIYNVTFSKFNENDSSNQKNNNSPFNFPFNSSPNINSLSTLFSSVSLHHRFEQHLNSAIVFSLFLSLSFSFAYLHTVNSTNSADLNFEKLFLYLAYRSFLNSSPSSSNQHTDSLTSSQEEFQAFSELSLYVFFSFFSHYYSLR